MIPGLCTDDYVARNLTCSLFWQDGFNLLERLTVFIKRFLLLKAVSQIVEAGWGLSGRLVCARLSRFRSRRGQTACTNSSAGEQGYPLREPSRGFNAGRK